MRDEHVADHTIARLAERQGGIVGRAQLLGLGMSPAAIGRRVRAGRLHPRHRGVYAVGHRRTGIDGAWWGAVLAYAPDGVLSDAAAAAAWGIARSRALHVSVGPGGRAHRAGITLHRRYLLDDEVTEHDGLPITTPARTLLDLAASGMNRTRLERAVDRAQQRSLVDFADMRMLLARYPHRRGTRSLNAVLASYADPLDVRSELEELVLELCDDHGLPRPHVNTVIEGKVRDFCWPACRLVVEADSYAWHRSPSALNADRERDVELLLAGWRVLRFTYAQVMHRREWVARAILAALRRVSLA
jgi:very-short-patch-repair endonuclease